MAVRAQRCVQRARLCMDGVGLAQRIDIVGVVRIKLCVNDAKLRLRQHGLARKSLGMDLRRLTRSVPR